MWPADAWEAAPVKSGSLVLIHGQVLDVANNNNAFAKVTSLSTNIVYLFVIRRSNDRILVG